MGYQRAQLKMAAKQAIRQSRCGPRLTTFLYMAVIWAASMVLGTVALYASGMSTMSGLLENAALWIDDPEFLMDYVLWAAGPRFVVTLVIYALISGILSFLLNSLMGAGYNGYCLSLMRRQEPQMSAIFSGFPKAGGVIVTKLLVGVFTVGWMLMFAGAELIVMMILSLIISSWAPVEVGVVLVLIGYAALFVAYFWVTLRYSMVDFLIMDQGMSGLDCIRESKRLTQGNVGRLFVLHLSFIGWYLLQGFLSLLGGFGMYGIMLAAITSLSAMGTAEPAYMIGFMLGLGLMGMVSLVTTVVSVVLSTWFKPYVAGSVALFYDWARGAAPPPAGPRSWDPGAQNFHYTWSDGPGGSGTGIGSGPRPGGPDAGEGWGSGGWGGGSAPSGPEQSGGKPDIPAPKQPPRDDPWA